MSDALTAFAAALEGLGIEPEEVEVSLPFERWQRLSRRLDEEMPNKVHDEIGTLDIAGVRYLIRHR